MRLQLFKTVLRLSNGKELPITIAAREITDIEELVNKNKVLYNTKDYSVDSFYVPDTRLTVGMDEETYQNELMFCDIVWE